MIYEAVDFVTTLYFPTRNNRVSPVPDLGLNLNFLKQRQLSII